MFINIIYDIGFIYLQAQIPDPVMHLRPGVR